MEGMIWIADDFDDPELDHASGGDGYDIMYMGTDAAFTGSVSPARWSSCFARSGLYSQAFSLAATASASKSCAANLIRPSKVSSFARSR